MTTPDFGDLYQELILDHYRRPRNRGRLDPADRQADGHNPLCGDRIHLMLRLDGDVIRDVAFESAGCAISTASASMMSEAVKGRTSAEAHEMFERFHGMVTGGQAGEGLGKLAAFANISRYPARVKCASLAWHTLEAALKASGETVTTE